MPGLRIADTVGLAGHDSGSFAGVRFNPYAAMPSLHVGWSVLVASDRSTARPRAPGCAPWQSLHPVLMALAVTATGNHYLADSLAGALVALLALVAVDACRAVHARHATAAGPRARAGRMRRAALGASRADPRLSAAGRDG